MTEYRIEHDTMGEVKVPVNALWRAQTQRAVNELIPKLFPETLGDITFASIIETITTIIINHKTVLKVEVKSNTIAIGIAPR